MQSDHVSRKNYFTCKVFAMLKREALGYKWLLLADTKTAFASCKACFRFPVRTQINLDHVLPKQGGRADVVGGRPR